MYGKERKEEGKQPESSVQVGESARQEQGAPDEKDSQESAEQRRTSEEN
jgi:hypothetical protein